MKEGWGGWKVGKMWEVGGGQDERGQSESGQGGEVAKARGASREVGDKIGTLKVMQRCQVEVKH
jgi:hypothetical protein